MYQSILSFSLLSLLLIFSSCSNSEAEKMIQKIDSSYAKIKTAEVKLLAIDTAHINEMMRYNTTSLAYIQNNFGDTATKEEAILMSDIIAVKRSFSKLLRQQNILVDDLIYSKTQLYDLKKDVENESISKENFDNYFETENKAINLFINSTESIKKWESSTEKRFEVLQPKIEVFLKEIENK